MGTAMSNADARAAAEGLIRSLGLDDEERRKRGPFLGVGLTTDQEGEPGIALHLRDHTQEQLPPIQKLLSELGSRRVAIRVSGVPRMLLLPAAQWFPANPSKVLEPGDPVLRPVGALGGDIGTLGAFVRVAGGVRFLSCNHVLAAVNRGRRGDPIWWGNVHATHCTYCEVGRLDQAPPIANGGSLDVALAEPHANGFQVSFPIPEGVGPVTGQRASFKDVPPKLAVEKVGCVTRRTQGKVFASPLLVFPMDYGSGAKFWFKDIISVVDGNFSAEGDSGSLVVTKKGSIVEAVGVLFAGDDDASYVSPIWDVLGALGARFC